MPLFCTERTTRLRGAAFAVVAFTLGTVCAYPLQAQQPSPPGAPPGSAPVTTPAIAAYRVPLIALVQPLPGGTVAQDRPALVFRFAQGEPDDPIDVASFAVAVDGEDRTKGFQVTGAQAWGPLGAAPPVGLHEVTARVCSSRGACATAQGSVAVLPVPTAAATTTSTKKKVLGAVLDFGKRLLLPR